MRPPLPSRLGKKTETKSIDGSPLIYVVEDEQVFEAPSNPNKAFCLQKLCFSDGRIEYRLCYYMIAHKPRMKGKWAYGQFAPMMTAEDMQLIFEKAKAKGWLIEDL